MTLRSTFPPGEEWAADSGAEEPCVKEQLIAKRSVERSEPDLGYQSREGTLGRPGKGAEKEPPEAADEAACAGEDSVLLVRWLHHSPLETPVEPLQESEAGGGRRVSAAAHCQGPTGAVHVLPEDGEATGPGNVQSSEDKPQHRATAPGCWKNIGVLQKIIVILISLLLVAICVLAWKFAHTEIPCSEEWTLYNGQCYYFSSEAKYWELAKKFCASHGARLAIIKDKQSLKTIDRFKGNEDYWIGLRKQKGSTWFWEDGSPFHNDTIAMENDAARLDCAYLNTKKIGVLECNTLRHWICVKERN